MWRFWARSIGYLNGTQDAPELAVSLRTWLLQVGNADPHNGKQNRLGGLSWADWARRAVVMAFEVDEDEVLDGALLTGQPLWIMAITVARSIAYLAGIDRSPELAEGVKAWLDGAVPKRACQVAEGAE
ncbi:MAG: hypothetical protein IPK82_20235 [Polyangiaceae bacterium]|nr:hypothetical protein [Polyangiaceae bacterium]